MKNTNYTKCLIGTAVTAAVGLSSMALASDDPYRGGYFGLRGGYSYNQDSCPDYAVKCDKEEGAYGVFFGYDANRNFGVELSANDIGDTSWHDNRPRDLTQFGQNSGAKVTQEYGQADLSLKFSTYLSERTRLYAKLGAAYWRAELAGTPDKYKSSGYRPLAGVGLEVPLSDHFAGRLEYQYIDKIGSRTIGYADPHYLGLALVWNFDSRGKRAYKPEPAVVPAPVAEPQPTPVVREQKIVVDESVNGPLFAFDSYNLTNTASIDGVVKILRDTPELNVDVIGHTDSVGTDAYNQRLSEQRAASVGRYLQSNGVSSNRITTSGKGESQPAADNSTAQGRALNRRVEFNISGVKVRTETIVPSN